MSLSLFFWLSGLKRRLSPSANVPSTRSTRRSSRSSQPAVYSVERLESRQLLSASPGGTETLVNTTTALDQSTYNEGQGGSIAMDADGDYVVTWTSNGQDGSADGVYARRYNAAGVAQGVEFQVNTYTTSFQFGSKVAMDADGDFVVTWTSAGQDLSGFGVYARRYDASGVAQGGEFRVNTTTAGDQNRSTVAMDALGDFVVTWTSYGQDLSGNGVYAQRYNVAGEKQGVEFRVNTYTASQQKYSTVAIDADGDFVVTWTSYGQDLSTPGVYARRYNAAGVAQGVEFQVNTYTTSNQFSSTVAMDADGDFVVTWTSVGQDLSDGTGVYAQRYNAAGVKQELEFRVNTYTTSNQYGSTVAMDSLGDFVVAWTSNSQDLSGFGVYAQRYQQTDLLDVTPPSSLVTALPDASTSTSFTVAVTGTDTGVGATGIDAYDLYYSTGSSFINFATVTAAFPSATFTGAANTTYWFRSIARDVAGNVEIKTSSDTYTRIGDVGLPTSQVTSATHVASGLFKLQMTGSKLSGAIMTQFDVYVVVDNAQSFIGTASAVPTATAGQYTGSLTYQGLTDASPHTYNFYSRGKDRYGKIELGPLEADVSVTVIFSAPTALTATGIDVQNSANQRSYVRYLDLLFSGNPSTLSQENIAVERFGIGATVVTAGTGVAVTDFVKTASPNKLKLDFGANGIGGLRKDGNGFYRVRLDMNRDGDFTDAGDQAFEFYRLFGDANGDGVVDLVDVNEVFRQIGTTGTNLDGDLDGSGTVNALDRFYTIQQRGKSLLPALRSLLDD